MWEYLRDRCDQAGVWDADFETASYLIGAKITEDDLLVFGDRIKKISDNKFWLVGFIDYQCGTLSSQSPAHKPVFKLIEKYGLDQYKFKPPEVITPLPEHKLEVFSSMFTDEIWFTNLQMTFKNRDYAGAFDECYMWHTSKPNPPQQLWEWRQKLISWLTIKKNDKPTKDDKLRTLVEGFAKRRSKPTNNAEME